MIEQPDADSAEQVAAFEAASVDEAQAEFTVNQEPRSIQWIESEEAPIDVAQHAPWATDEPPPDFAANQNRRSIHLIEGKEVSNEVVFQGVNQNLRSIQMIEGKEVPIEVAQPAASSDAYPI